MILARNGKAFQGFVVARCQATADMRERQADFYCPPSSCSCIPGPEYSIFFAVGFREGGKREAFAHVLLVFGMDVARVADVRSHGDTRIRQMLRRHQLRFAQFRPGVLDRVGVGLLIIGELHDIEGESPSFQRDRQSVIIVGSRVRYWYALPALDSP